MRWVVVALLVPLLAGCVSEDPPETPAPVGCGEGECEGEAPKVAAPQEINEPVQESSDPTACELASCRTVVQGCRCFEPTVAVFGSEVWMAPANERQAWVEVDGGVHTVELPPVPAKTMPADGIVQVQDGRLYHSALHYQGPEIPSMHVAQWDEASQTWAWVHQLDAPAPVVDKACPVPSVPVGCNDIRQQASLDRQWVLGRGDQVFVFLQGLGFAAPFFAAGGSDGFEDLRPVASHGSKPINGRPIDADGMFVWPMFLSDDDSRDLVVLRSPDGQDWERVVVVEGGESAPGHYFPAVAAMGDRLVLAYRDLTDRLLLVESQDGGATWGTPIEWDAGPIMASPWVEADEGLWAVAWYKDTEPAQLWLDRAAPGLASGPLGATALVLDTGAKEEGTRRSLTDFAHITVADGLWWTWSTSEEAMMLAGPLD